MGFASKFRSLGALKSFLYILFLRSPCLNGGRSVIADISLGFFRFKIV
jgi:hypothetical protein